MYSQIASNKRKSVILASAFVLLVTGLGYVYSLATGHPGVTIVVAVFAVIYAFVSYFASANIALAVAGAQAVAKADAPELYRVVENLSIASGLPMPKVYIMNDPSPNAFATGRDPKHAVVAVTTGALELFDKEELEGVIAHELSHVGNYDIRFMAVVMVMVTVIALLSDFFMRWSWFGDSEERENNPLMLAIGIGAAILAPIIATLLQLAVSRKREYLADASGALLTRYPEGLARALEKIEARGKPLVHASSTNAHMYFSNPFGGRSKSSFIANLFSTHPPIEDRIAKLRAMEGQV
jgi:heat shock protein HtpX